MDSKEKIKELIDLLVESEKKRLPHGICPYGVGEQRDMKCKRYAERLGSCDLCTSDYFVNMRNKLIKKYLG